MKKVLICLAFLYISLLILPSEEIFCQDFSIDDQKWLDEIGSLRFSEVDWMPLSLTSEYPEYKGIIADYLKIISKATGLEFEYIQSRTWQEVLEKYRNHEIELLPAISVGDDVGAELLFTDPYISFPLVIVTRGKDIGFISNTSELRGERVGVGNGYTSHNFLKSHYPDIELITTDNVREGLLLVENGTIDAFVGHLAVVRHAMEECHLDLRIAGKTEYVFEHRLGLPPEHARTIEIINRVLSRITPEEHSSIYNKWIRIDARNNDHSLFWKMLLGAFVIILGIIIWNRKISAKRSRVERLLEDMKLLKEKLEERNIELDKLAKSDKLTGIGNRCKLDEVLEYEIDYYQRYKKSIGLILLDIDHFKNVNDKYGHPTGDRVLICISQLLKTHIRRTDTLGRWGGEEFLIICRGPDEKGIEEVAEKLRLEIEQYDFPVVHSCTASFGVSLFQEGDDLTLLMRRVDEALYTAKNNGRNQVVVYKR